MLTGATGLIGAAIADLLIWYNKDRNVPVELYAAGRNEKQIEEKFKPYEKQPGSILFHMKLLEN